MESAFDPYYLWLGIPPQEQPPNHYRLLGIVMFESNRNVIEAAADRQMTFLRQYGIGAHSEASQKLLNEVSQARLELLNPAKKAAYDERLKKQIDQEIAADKSDRPVPIQPASEPKRPAAAAGRPAPAKTNPVAKSSAATIPPAERKPRRKDSPRPPRDEDPLEEFPDDAFEIPVPPRRSTNSRPQKSQGIGVLPWAIGGGATLLVLIAVLLMRGGSTPAAAGTLNLSVAGTDGVVLVDGAEVPPNLWTTPMPLPAGQHTVEWRRNGHPPVTSRFWIVAATATPVRLEPPALPSEQIVSATSSSGTSTSETASSETATAIAKPNPRDTGNPSPQVPSAPVAQAPIVLPDLDKLPDLSPKEIVARLLEKAAPDSSFVLTMGITPQTSQSQAVRRGDPLPEQLFNVTSVTFRHGSMLTPEDYALLQKLPELTGVTFMGGGWTGRELVFLRGHPNIRYVNFLTIGGGNCVKFEGAQYLSQIPGLRNLQLDGVIVSQTDMETIATIRTIESLAVATDHATADSFRPLSKMVTLRSLALKQTDASGDGPTDDDLRFLNSMANLSNLYVLNCSRFTGSAFSQPAALPYLNSIIFSGSTGVTNAGVKAIAEAAPNLTSLGIDRSPEHLTGAMLESLASLKSLQTVMLHNRSNIEDGDLEPLLKIPQLRIVRFPGSRITDKGVAVLAQHPTIWTLDLTSTQITDESCSHLAKMKSLENVTLSHTKISLAGALKLRERAPHLRTLEIKSVRIRFEDLEQLKSALPGCRIYGP